MRIPKYRLSLFAIVLAVFAVSAPAASAAPDDELRQQMLRVGEPVKSTAAQLRSEPELQSAASTPGWIDGNIQYQTGTSCIILGQPSPGQLQTGSYAGYFGTQDVSYPKIGDRYWGHVVVSVIGPGCALGIHLIATEIQLPVGTQLAINPQSNDPADKVRCFGVTTQNQLLNLTDQTWQHPDDPSFKGKYCDSTQVFQGANGLHLGQRLLGQGQTFEIIFPLRSTRKLSGIAEPNNASRLTGAVTGSGHTNAFPFQWVFVGDRPVEATCPAVGTDAASAITNTTARTRNYMCHWYRTGKAQIEIGEGTSGPYQASSPQYDVGGQYQAYYFDQDWGGLKPGTDYHWRLKFTDTKGTATTSDDQVYFGQPRTFKTTGSPPPPGSGGGPPVAGSGGAGDGTKPPGSGGPSGGDGRQGQQQQEQEQGDRGTRVPRDVVAPKLTATIRRTRLGALLKKGLRATATCSEACTLSAKLQVDKRTARKLKLGRKITTIGKGRKAAPRGGKATVTVKLTKKARKRLTRVRKLKATVVLVATDSAGNKSAAVRKRMTLRR